MGSPRLCALVLALLGEGTCNPRRVQLGFHTPATATSRLGASSVQVWQHSMKCTGPVIHRQARHRSASTAKLAPPDDPISRHVAPQPISHIRWEQRLAALLCNVLLAVNLVLGGAGPFVTPPAYAQPGVAAAPDIEFDARMGIVDEVWGLLNKYYLDRTFNNLNWEEVHADLKNRAPYDEKQAQEQANKLVKRLGDKYTRTVSPEKADALSKYDVTGVNINLINNAQGQLTVGAVPPKESPAAMAGIQFGDVVRSINGLNADGMTAFEALEAIQATTDNIVELTFTSAADGVAGPERTAKMERKFTPKNPVVAQVKKLPDGSLVGYIRLKEFNARCKREFRTALEDLEAQGVDQYVLDMRGNHGGVLEGAIGIAGYFLEDSRSVLLVRDANGMNSPFQSKEKQITKDPLVVWVDEETASSAEVLAGALHDNNRASLMGVQTYGKGLIQGVFGLSNGGALITTVAEYTTPCGTPIQKVGLPPDVRTSFSPFYALVDSDLANTKFVRPGAEPLCAIPTIDADAASASASTPIANKE